VCPVLQFVVKLFDVFLCLALYLSGHDVIFGVACGAAAVGRNIAAKSVAMTPVKRCWCHH